MDLVRTSQHLFTSFHVQLYRWTGGLIGHRIGSVENVVLTTTGRRSGKARSTPLTVTVDGDRLVLVASNGGAPKHPDWYLNLTANPEVKVQRGREVIDMRARTATAAERTELWPKVLKSWRGYEGYQKKTEREIPLVICEPAG
jgi:deazaflavin-dependent oxidoreductase (nitroreductase family)